jgi:exonuclease VII small subunit
MNLQKLTDIVESLEQANILLEERVKKLEEFSTIHARLQLAVERNCKLSARVQKLEDLFLLTPISIPPISTLITTIATTKVQEATSPRRITSEKTKTQQRLQL